MSDIGFAMLYEPRSMFDIPLNEADLFTQVPRWRRFFDTDELALRQCTAGFFLASRRMDKIVARFSELRPVPVHLLMAGDERIIDSEKTVSFVRGLGWPLCRITAYDDLRHSLEFEGNPETYFADLTAFLDEVSQRSSEMNPEGAYDPE